MLTVTYTDAAIAGAERLPQKMRTAMIRKINAVAEDQTTRRKWFSALTDRPGFKVRQGDFRAIVKIADGVLTVTKMGHRKEIYR